jgi:hypothetical protein
MKRAGKEKIFSYGNPLSDVHRFGSTGLENI